jgi:hypothetical protein
VHLCSLGKSTSEERQAHFEQWKQYYKTAVGALHIWSWRLTPILGSILMSLGSRVVLYLVELIYLYSHIMNEPEILKRERMSLFQKVGASGVQRGLLYTLLLLILVSAIAMISIRYRRLHLLIATIRLPKHRLEDFQIIQSQNAAMQIFDFPVTAKTVISLLQLLFVQTVLFTAAYASAGS